MKLNFDVLFFKNGYEFGSCKIFRSNRNVVIYLIIEVCG